MSPTPKLFLAFSLVALAAAAAAGATAVASDIATVPFQISD
jgi:hypothetical protein